MITSDLLLKSFVTGKAPLMELCSLCETGQSYELSTTASQAYNVFLNQTEHPDLPQNKT